MLGSAGPPKILRRYGQDTSLCIVEGKSTSMFATAGQGQVAMESLTLATEAPRTFRWQVVLLAPKSLGSHMLFTTGLIITSWSRTGLSGSLVF